MLGQRLARGSARTGRPRASCSSVEQAGAHAVVDVVRVVGDLVGQVAQLRLQAGLRARRGSGGRRRRARPPRAAAALRARAVLEDALARLEAQVQAVELRDSAPPARRPRAGSAGCARSRRAPRMQSSSASWPAWPNGVWPRSCASAMASTRSSFRPQRARDRARRAAPPPANASGACGTGRLRGSGRPASCRPGGGTRWSGRCGRGRAGSRCASAPAAPDGGGRASAPGRRRRAASVMARRSRRAQAPCSACAAPRRTSASGAARTTARPGASMHHEADLAGLGLLVDAHQFEVALGARVAARATGRPARVDQRGHALRRRPRRPARARCDSCAPSPCRSPRPRRAATRRSPGPPRSRGRRCGRS